MLVSDVICDQIVFAYSMIGRVIVLYVAASVSQRESSLLSFGLTCFGIRKVVSYLNKQISLP